MNEYRQSYGITERILDRELEGLGVVVPLSYCMALNNLPNHSSFE